jgi:DNA polymerase-3 subunit epsilon
MTNNMLLRKKLAEIYQNQDDYLILDTETTGLVNPEIAELSIINLSGEALINRRLKPKGLITDGAIAIHGIRNEDVQRSPTLPNFWGKFSDVIEGKTLLIYNADFDLNALSNSMKAWGLKSLLETKYVCMMHLYSQFIDEPGRYQGSYRWQKLPGGNHTALGDCQATLAILQKMWRVLDADNYVVRGRNIATPFSYQYKVPQQVMSYDDFAGLYPF